jgi:hypothetical protein
MSSTKCPLIATVSVVLLALAGMAGVGKGARGSRGAGGRGGAPGYGGGQSDPTCAPNAGSFFGGGVGVAQQGSAPLKGGAMGYCCHNFHL